MSGHEPFLAAIRSAPGDPLPKLMYQDWCDERGAEPRCPYTISEFQTAIRFSSTYTIFPTPWWDEPPSPRTNTAKIRRRMMSAGVRKFTSR